MAFGNSIRLLYSQFILALFDFLSRFSRLSVKRSQDKQKISSQGQNGLWLNVGHDVYREVYKNSLIWKLFTSRYFLLINYKYFFLLFYQENNGCPHLCINTPGRDPPMSLSKKNVLRMSEQTRTAPCAWPKKSGYPRNSHCAWLNLHIWRRTPFFSH